MAPSSTSDETYLEAFIDQLSTVPAEIRRNMEWMKDLDQSCSVLLQDLARRQREYISQVERKVVRNLEVGDDGQGVRIVPAAPSAVKESKTTSSMEGNSSASIRTSKNKPSKKKLKTETASETETVAASSTNLSSPPEPVVVIPTT